MPITALKPTQELVDLVGTLGGKWHGASAMCRCPAHEDQTPSLSLRQGDQGILVHCFGGCASKDVLRELRRVKPTVSFPARPEPRTRDTSSLVERIWRDGRPVGGTAAERYLERRRLDACLSDIRFHPRCPKGAKPLTVFIPALLIAIRDNGRMTAIQRIFLDPETGGYTEKLTIGPLGAGAWRGAPVTDTVAVGEGFETAAAFNRIHDLPCWASVGARRLDLLDFPASITTIILAEDNDPEGRRAADKAWQAYRERGLIIRRMPPPKRYGDWADVLK